MRLAITIILLIFPAFTFPAYAQKVRNVSGEYIYYPPENLSLEQAKVIAIERARLEAIANEFGTNVSQSNTTVVANRNGESDIKFQSYGSSDVNGDWLADTKDAEIAVSYDSGMLVVKAKVWGKVRERKRAELELSIQTLCNGRESEKFNNNDRFSVRFRSPVNGYLSIWLADDNLKQVYCLLPYENAGGIAREIRSRLEYLMLTTSDETYPYREETVLTTECDVEYNRLLFLFSTTPFMMPLTEQGEYVPELVSADFDKWLQRNRIKDENFCVIQKMIEINK